MRIEECTTPQWSSWWGYVRALDPDSTQAGLGVAAGVNQATVARWKAGATAGPEAAARFARSYGRPVLEAFVAAGILTLEEAGQAPSTWPAMPARGATPATTAAARAARADLSHENAAAQSVPEVSVPSSPRLGGRLGEVCDEDVFLEAARRARRAARVDTRGH